MTDSACNVFLDLILLSVRMAPVFVCLKPKYGTRENIAAVSAYLWVVMESLRCLFMPPPGIVSSLQIIFSALYLLVMLVFFEGGQLLKAFLYISAWMFSQMFYPFYAFAAFILLPDAGFSYAQVSLLVSIPLILLFSCFIVFFFKKRVTFVFESLSPRNSTLMIAVPSAFLILMYFGSQSVFSPGTLRSRGTPDILFYMVLCVMMITLYLLLIYDIERLIDQRRTRAELELVRRTIDTQRDYYNRVVEYRDAIRVFRHDFRHHIHALIHMNQDDRKKYLQKLKQEIDHAPDPVFCDSNALNSLFQEYAALCRNRSITCDVLIDLSGRLPVDELNLCVIIGNLLQNALEACEKVSKDRFIRFRARWSEDRFFIMMENSYNGKLRVHGNRLLSSKKNGGIGMDSIRRILNHAKDDLDFSFTDDVVTIMVSIFDRNV